MQAMSAFVAQNHGAGKPERAIEGLKTTIGLSTAFGVAMFWLAFFHGDLLCGAFSSDPEVVAAGFDYLKAYGIDCLLTCFLFCFIGFYNGLGRTGFVMLQGIAAAFLIRIPVAYIMCQTTGRLFYIGLGIPLIRIPVAYIMCQTTGRLFYIGLGIPCSTVFQILLCFAYFSRVRRRR